MKIMVRVTLTLLLLIASSGYAAESYYDLQIIQPQPNLTVENRFYKAYPGLLYEVRLAVVGGAYPFKYSLDKAPAGMTINANKGVISWSSPAQSTTPYNVTARVTDSNGVYKTVAWTITVTKDKFMFVDPVNGKTGATGTIDDPVKGFYDVYGGNDYNSKYATKNKGYFVYFKGGTYVLDGYTGGSQGVQYTNRQPMVWLAYPGQRPVIDMTNVALRLGDTSGDNFYVDGFEINSLNTNASTEYRMMFRVTSSSSNVTFRNNIFHNIAYTSGSYNQSAIMISKDQKGKYWSISDNEFYDIHGAYGILGYTAQYVLIEDNYLHDTDNSHPIGPKIQTTFWFIRHNTIKNAKNWGIWLYGEDNFYDMEVSYNNVIMTSGMALSVNQAYNNALNNIYIFRNTFVGDVQYYDINNSAMNLIMKKNVIINTAATGYVSEGSNALGSIQTITDNFVKKPTDGAVDADGKLTKTYIDKLGYYGWQIGSPPLPPSDAILN